MFKILAALALVLTLAIPPPALAASKAKYCADVDFAVHENDAGEAIAVTEISLPINAFGTISSVDYTWAWVTIPNKRHTRRIVDSGLDDGYFYIRATKLKDADRGDMRVSISGKVRTSDGTVCRFHDLTYRVRW